MMNEIANSDTDSENKDLYVHWHNGYAGDRNIRVFKLCDDDSGLTIDLGNSPESITAQLVFENVYAYRNLDESFRARLFRRYQDGLPNLFYRVTGSTLLQWFHEESMNIYDDKTITHYAIVTTADCIDVLTDCAPALHLISLSR